MISLNEKYEKICAYTRTGYWFVDFSTEKILFDVYLQNVLEIGATEVSIYKLTKQIVKNERLFFRSALKMFKYSGDDFHYPIHFISGTSVLLAEVSLRPESTDADNRVVTASGFIYFVPEMQQFSISLLDSILQYMPAYFFVKDPENAFRYIYASPSTKDLFIYHADDPIGRDDYNLFGNTDLANFFREKDLEVSLSHHPLHYTEEIFNSQGEQRVVDTVKAPLKYWSHKSYILGMAWDITYQKKIEALLLENQQRIHIACENALVYPWTWNVVEREGEISVVENGKVTTKKVSYEEFFDTVHPDDQFDFNKSMSSFIIGDAKTIHVSFRCNFLKEEYIWYEMLGKMYEYNKDGQPFRGVGMIRNIDEFKHNEEIALQTEELKSDFLANITHEIHTPMNAISGFSSLIGLAKTEEERAEFLKIIDINIGLLSKLLNDIIDVSKMESGNTSFHYTEFQLNDAFISQLLYWKRLINPDVEIVFENNGTDYLIVSDQNRFIQVLFNLLSNAQKFTLKGSIRFGYTLTDTGLYVYVTDTGCGIPLEFHSTIFKRFEKVDKFVQGAGLGLSICKVIITILKGEIGVYSEEGVGSTFWFTIPCNPVKWDENTK